MYKVISSLFFHQTVKAFLPWMMENDYGYIVQICSICGFVPGSGLTDYCASKSAAVAFAETLRTELIAANKSGISVTCVCPSHIWNTAMFASVKPKLTWIMPSLRAVDVAERTVRAVQEKQFLVAIPRTFYLFLFLKGLVGNVTCVNMAALFLSLIATVQCTQSYMLPNTHTHTRTCTHTHTHTCTHTAFFLHG